MATINLEILEAAHTDGLLPKRLSVSQKLYLHSSVQTANQIYWAIAAADEGLDSEQLQKAITLAKNTLFQYTRWLEMKGLIVNEAPENRKNLYFAAKRSPLKKR